MEKVIDRRHVYGFMVDTETANTIEEENGKLDMSSVLPYDFGFAIIDSHGHVYETMSFVNSDIFYGESVLMRSAYYANKIPQYIEDIYSGKRILATTYEIRQWVFRKTEEYNCQFVCAHNALFDYRACNNAQRWTTMSKYRYFFPKGLEWWDTLKMARQVIAKMPSYKAFCVEHDLVTKRGAVRMTAEALYRFISNNVDFVESHTGLEDVLIEAEILAYCVKQHKKMDKNLFSKTV